MLAGDTALFRIMSARLSCGQLRAKIFSALPRCGEESALAANARLHDRRSMRAASA
jgi:hypothetical protein